MSHVGNFDIRLMTITAVLVGVIAVVSDLFLRSRFFGFGRSRDDNNSGQLMAIVGIIAAILAPIVAMLIQLAISRKREFLADADGALLTRYPDGLASALEKISQYSEPVEHVSSATAHLYISNPLGGEDEKEQSFFAKIFATHPPIKERIKALRDMSV
jgi:heat shock protein HtpX